MVAKKRNIVAENGPLLKHCDCERYSLNIKVKVFMLHMYNRSTPTVTKTTRMKRASNVSGLGSLKELYRLYSTRQLTLKLYKSWHNDSSFHDAQNRSSYG